MLYGTNLLFFSDTDKYFTDYHCQNNDVSIFTSPNIRILFGVTKWGCQEAILTVTGLYTHQAEQTRGLLRLVFQQYFGNISPTWAYFSREVTALRSPFIETRNALADPNFKYISSLMGT